MAADRPRVLYATPMFGYPPLGGPRLRTYTTLRALSRCADVSLDVWQVPDVVDPVAARAHLLTFCRDVTWVDPPPPPRGLPRIAARARSLARRLRARPTPQADGAKAAIEPLLDRLTERVLAEDVDLVWLGFGGISYPLLDLKRRTGRPIVCETESVWSRFILREAPFATSPERRAAIEREGAAKAAEEAAGARLADVTTAVSEVDADYFRSLADSPEQVMLLPNVIDVAAYAAAPAGPALKTPAVTFAGTLGQGTANVDAALWLLDEVMPRVWAEVGNLRLYLVGRNPAPELRRRAGPRVDVTGEVASIVPYFRQSLAALVPLRWESGTRFKILEAFACRTPVVSTTLGAEGLAVTHDRDILLADTPAAFAEAIGRLARQPELRARLTGPAYELVRSEYDLSSAERHIRAILDRVLASRSSGRT
jgi:polysaccharide biosynthesis protein PslH